MLTAADGDLAWCWGRSGGGGWKERGSAFQPPLLWLEPPGERSASPPRTSRLSPAQAPSPAPSTSASCRNPPTVPPRAAEPAERRLAPHPARPGGARRGPGRRALTSGAGVVEDGARCRARPGGAEPPGFQGAQGNARERDSHPQEPVNKDPFVPAPSLSRGDRSPVGVVLEKGRRQVGAGTRPQPGAWEGAVPPVVSERAEAAGRPRGRWPPSGTPDTASARDWSRVASS